MISHVDLIARQIYEMKENEPEKFKRLIEEGIIMGLGVDLGKEAGELTTSDQIKERNRPKEKDYAAISDAVIAGDKITVQKRVSALLAAGKNPTDLVLNALMPGIQTVCELYDVGDCYVPEILLANDALTGGVALCQERIGAIPSPGKVASLVIVGDLHDIGKNIVAAILRANGFEVVDLGRDVTVEKAIEAAKAEKVDLVTGTTLMSTTKGGLEELAKGLECLGVPLACGGAAVDKHFVETFGNSVYGKTPLDAVKIARKVCEGKSWEEVRKELH